MYLLIVNFKQYLANERFGVWNEKLYLDSSEERDGEIGREREGYGRRDGDGLREMGRRGGVRARGPAEREIENQTQKQLRRTAVRSSKDPVEETMIKKKNYSTITGKSKINGQRFEKRTSRFGFPTAFGVDFFDGRPNSTSGRWEKSKLRLVRRLTPCTAGRNGTVSEPQGLCKRRRLRVVITRDKNDGFCHRFLCTPSPPL